jgi:hypothetical protein
MKRKEEKEVQRLKSLCSAYQLSEELEQLVRKARKKGILQISEK